MRQYLDLLQRVLDEGTDRSDRTGIGTRALFGMQMRFDMEDGFPAVTTKKLAFNAVKAELLWFIEGSDDERRLAEIVHGSRDTDKKTIWTQNAEAPYWVGKARFPGDVGRIYGVQWRRWQSFYTDVPMDQLKEVIEQIKKDPCSRRHIVTAWNPRDLQNMALPPCHVMFQFFVAGDKLSLHLYQRSCDMFLGVPFNIVSYSLLLHMVAQVTSLKPWEFVHTLGDTHIYHNHFNQVREQLSRTPLSLPSLWLNPDVKNIEDFKMDDIRLDNYQSHPAIKAEMAV